MFTYRYLAGSDELCSWVRHFLKVRNFGKSVIKYGTYYPNWLHWIWASNAGFL